MNAQLLSTSIRRFAIGGSVAAALALAAAEAIAQSGAQAGPLRLEVRVFSGIQEVTPNTAVQIYRAGDRASAIPYTKSDGALVASVEPGAYDMQALWQPEGKVVAMRWQNGMYVERYPGEAGRYITAMNLKGGHGALQLRPKGGASGRLDWTAAAFKAGDSNSAVASLPVQGDGYTLMPLPAGRYDVMIQSGGKSTWLKNVEVVSDRTDLHHIAFP